MSEGPKQYKAWQRVEPHSRNTDFSKGLLATIHDPAWMLARQWQLGEFQGEDSGSPINVDVNTKHDEVTLITLNDGKTYLEYDKEMPLEVLVEKTKVEVLRWKAENNNNNPLPNWDIDLKNRVRLGLQFQREMDSSLENILPLDRIRLLKKQLASSPEFLFNQPNEQELEYEMDNETINNTKNYLSIVSKKVINIFGENITDVPSALRQKAREYFSGNLGENVANALIIAYNNLKEWWDGSTNSATSISTPSNKGKEEPFFEKLNKDTVNSAWDPRHLDYSFKLQIGLDGNDNNNNSLILDASEYKEEHLDWYSFTIERKNGSVIGNSNSPLRYRRQQTNILSTNLKFPGVPERRWWNFEDSYVDFGSVDPKINNLATMLLMDFALVHSAEWYSIPFLMDVGMINQIESFIITDTFGDQISIEPAGSTEEELKISKNYRSWDSWNMFTLSTKYTNVNEPRNDQKHYFFLAPTIDIQTINSVILGPPLEEIRFLRDEVANYDWAVEKKYRTFYGESTSGDDYYLSRKKQMEDKNFTSVSEKNNNNAILYSLMTGVPWNWIPFVPVHSEKLLMGNRNSDLPYTQIQLQRAGMPETIGGKSFVISPRSRILNEVPSEYYIDESEIPGPGLVIWEKCQRVVGSNGRIFLWIARKRSIGRGEGSSGLKFDYIPVRRTI